MTFGCGFSFEKPGVKWIQFRSTVVASSMYHWFGSLYTDVVLFSFSLFSKTSASSLAKQALEKEK